MIELRVACSPGEARIAACDGDTVLDHALWRPGLPDGFGDRHVVRVTHPVEAMGGAFVLLEDGATGFLTGSHRQDDLVAAIVTRSPQGGKGLRLKPLPPPLDDAAQSDGPRLLSRGATPLASLAALHPDAPILIDAPAFTARVPPALRERVTRVPSAFDAALASRVAALADPRAELSGGVVATIFPTPALVAIDLDNPAAARTLRSTMLVGANMAAIPALCREIRLRNLSGAILVDPAGVPPRKRRALLEPFRTAFAADPLTPQTLGTTALGLIEIVRTRTRPPLHELLSSPHGIGLAALRSILASRPTRVERPPVLKASIAVVTALEADRLALDEFATAWGAPLRLELAPDYPLSFWSHEP
ncbi:ribonuclease E/G [Acidomonas methanolica]|uniref:RNA-binding protein AU-1/Ribonuclease E/G domain-containing protein n=2 Tax=Acidomonas methanolica TaxID=437 RepID=A0A023D533_ACIMT|nr:ribonuclease E/G [Acidomonas methanolica]MBU2653729.1 ribonuclease E/G [Acidomonas methanolica]TCS31681.1 Rne/Rng family ribonuclease [Acidomonas methanolica]GAJ28895.1 hypothetical protein Amme_038_144 [Acidomonas methanolica NBRC 104435]GEK98099.1 hypothetical protein AME01nite_05980 [Acidomonas methanolica NBRC 104435]